MTIKFTRILSLVIWLGVGYVGLWSLEWCREQIDLLRPLSVSIPNVPLDDVPVISPVLDVDHWQSNDETIENLYWSNIYNSVPGIVSIERWKSSNRIYYRLKGPVNPDFKLQRFKFPICQVYLPDGFRVETWELWLKDDKLIFFSQKDNAKSRLAERCCKADIVEGYITILFWVPKKQIVGNIVFNYEEKDYFAWVAMDKPRTTDHANLLNWNLR